MGLRIGKRVTLPGLLPLLALLLVVGGVAAAIAERRSDSAGEARAADSVGGQYVSDVATFRAQVVHELARHRGAHPEELRSVLDAAIPQFPKLPSPPPGAEDSKSFQHAVRVSTDSLKPFTSLREQLDIAAQAEVFVETADAALQRSTNALLSTALVYSVEPLEDRTLPELRDALADVRRLPIPAKGQPAARAVDGAISAAIGEVETMIEKFEAGEQYSFDLSDRFANARTQLKDYAIDVDGDVREAVARLREGG